MSKARRPPASAEALAVFALLKRCPFPVFRLAGAGEQSPLSAAEDAQIGRLATLGLVSLERYSGPACGGRGELHTVVLTSAGFNLLRRMKSEIR